MGGGGRGTLAQHVPFDLAAFVPPFTFFFFPTFAPEGGGAKKEKRKESLFLSAYYYVYQSKVTEEAYML